MVVKTSAMDLCYASVIYYSEHDVLPKKLALATISLSGLHVYPNCTSRLSYNIHVGLLSLIDL